MYSDKATGMERTVNGTMAVSYTHLEEARAFVDTLSTEQLIALASGDPGKGQGSNLGSAGDVYKRQGHGVFLKLY